MVGVGGRSKACDNCRRRRVKCDETQPVCGRCLKAKLKCEGPRLMTIIQFHGGKQQEQYASTQGSEDRYGDASNNMAVVPAGYHASRPQYTGRPLPLFGIKPEEDDLFLIYTRKNILHGQEPDRPNFSAPDMSLTEKCLLALSTTYFGAEHGQSALVHRGLRRYSTALSELNFALSDPTQCRTNDVLESVIVMSLFEFLTSTSQDAWIHHARGLEVLMKLRGPDSFTSPESLAFLEKSQASIIMAALAIHQPTIFAKPEWKRVPWSLQPERRTAVHDLYDILADCTELYAMKDEQDAEAITGHENPMYKNLLDAINDLLVQLDLWQAEWNILHSDSHEVVPCRSKPPSQVGPDGVSRPLWYTTLQFSSLHHANGHGLSHAILILLLRLQRATLTAAGLLMQQHSNTERTMFDAGISICRSVDYHIDNSRAGAGSLFLLFPLRMAYDAIAEQSSSAAQWVTKVLQDINAGSAGRWALAKSLLDIRVQQSNPP